MTTIIQLENGERAIEIPDAASQLEGFRTWTRSPEFTERGRIDWVDGKVWVDLVAEDVGGHGTLKATIAAWLYEEVVPSGLGIVLIDRTRVVHDDAGLCAEPDVVMVLASAIENARVKLIPGEEGQILELEGAPDLVVECLSRSSTLKDTKILRDAYFAAGIPEYWIADGRQRAGNNPDPFASLEILTRGATGFEATATDTEQRHHSPLFDCNIRIRRHPFAGGLFRYEIET